MNLPGLAVRRPVTILMVILLVLVMGFVSLSRIGLDLLPDMTFPVAAVITEYEGAGPEEVETLVTEPVEEVVGTVENVERITSTSSPGSSMVLIEFTWGTDMDFAALDVREQVDMLGDMLPDDVSDPMVVQFDPAMMPIMVIGLGGYEDLEELTESAEDTLEPRLERLEGVASVDVTGGMTPEILVALEHTALAKHNLALLEVAEGMAQANLDLPGGTLEEGEEELLVRTVGSFEDVEDVATLSLMTPDGVAVTPRDLGEVAEGRAETDETTLLNGLPAVGLTVQKQADANTVEVGRAIKAEMEEIQEQYPDLESTYVLDQSDFIEVAISNVTRNGVVGAILAVLVLLLFLRNLHTTLVIAAAIPIAVVGAFVLIHFAGLTFNLISLGGLALGLGMLVDSAIVVLENVFRHREEGSPAPTAAEEGASEVGMAVTASTLTTVGVFLPVVYVEGLVSQIFSELALTVTFSLLAALLVSLTLIPLLASRLLQRESKSTARAPSGWLFRLGEAVNHGLGILEQRYRGALAWSLAHRRRVLGAALLVFLLTLATLPLLGTEFLPDLDEGRIVAEVEMPRGTALERTQEVAEEVGVLAQEIPEVENVYLSAGAGGQMMGLGAGDADEASLEIRLVDQAERGRTSWEVASELRQAAGKIPGASITVEARDMLTDDAAMGGAPVQVNIRGDDLDQLEALSEQLLAGIEGIPGLENVESALEEGRPELHIEPHDHRLASLGIDLPTLSQTVDTAVEGTVATELRENGEETDIRVQLAGDVGVSELQSLLVPGMTDMRMTLGDVADLQIEEGPTAIEREDQERMVSVSAQLEDRDLGAAMDDVEEQVQELELPQGYQVDYGGEYQEMVEAFEGLALAAALAVVVVYAVLASQFESLLHPFTIMFSVPFAATGALLGLLVAGQTLNVVAAIGGITLAGIVVNNAIVLVDYINTLRRRGLERTQAIIQAGRTRLRPILMTTSTTVLALVPLALGWGEGAEIQVPMAVAIIGGLLLSTLLTLFLVPTLYAVLEDLPVMLAGKKEAPRALPSGKTEE